MQHYHIAQNTETRNDLRVLALPMWIHLLLLISSSVFSPFLFPLPFFLSPLLYYIFLLSSFLPSFIVFFDCYIHVKRTNGEHGSSQARVMLRQLHNRDVEGSYPFNFSLSLSLSLHLFIFLFSSFLFFSSYCYLMIG